MKKTILNLFALLIMFTLLPVNVSAQTSGNSSSSGTENSFGPALLSTLGSSAIGCAKNTAVQGLIGLSSAALSGFNKEVPVGDATLKYAKTCLDGAAYSIAKKMLQQLSSSTINWANTGFGGNPLYVQDQNSFLKRIKDREIEGYLTKIQGSNPIFGNALRSTVTQQITGKTDGLVNKVMDTPEARSYNAFMGDFSQGGWDAWLNTTQVDRNNPIGATFQAAGTLAQKIDAKQAAAEAEIQRNNGFLDMKECVEWEKPQTAQITTATSSDSCTAKYTDQRRQELQNCKVQNTTVSAFAGSTQNTAAITKCENGVNKKYDDLVKACMGSTPGIVGGNGKLRCLKDKTVTPGSIIAEQVAGITGSTQGQLELADSLNEVLTSFFDRLVNNLFSRGLAALGGRGTGSDPNGLAGLNVALDSNGNTIMTSNVSGASGISGDFDISRPQHTYAILKTQYNFLNRTYDAHMAINEIIPTLGRLDYCFPGPNPTWQQGLASNYQTWVSSIKQTKFAGNRTWDTTGAYLDDKTSMEPRRGASIDTALGGGPIFEQYIYQWIDQGFKDLTDLYKSTFSKVALTNAYVSLESTLTNQNFAEGQVEDIMDELSQLPAYSQNIDGINAQYETNEVDARRAIRELEDIRQQVNALVATAKARYIAEQAANGTPVDLACINKAYVIDNNQIVPVARQKSDIPDPIIEQSAQARRYFYSRL